MLVSGVDLKIIAPHSKWHAGDNWRHPEQPCTRHSVGTLFAMIQHPSAPGPSRSISCLEFTDSSFTCR